MGRRHTPSGLPSAAGDSDSSSRHRRGGPPGPASPPAAAGGGIRREDLGSRAFGRDALPPVPRSSGVGVPRGCPPNGSSHARAQVPSNVASGNLLAVLSRGEECGLPRTGVWPDLLLRPHLSQGSELVRTVSLPGWKGASPGCTLSPLPALGLCFGEAVMGRKRRARSGPFSGNAGPR